MNRETRARGCLVDTIIIIVIIILCIIFSSSCRKPNADYTPAPAVNPVAWAGTIAHLHHIYDKDNKYINTQIAWVENWKTLDSIHYRWLAHPHLQKYCYSNDYLEIKFFIPAGFPYKQNEFILMDTVSFRNEVKVWSY